MGDGWSKRVAVVAAGAVLAGWCAPQAVAHAGPRPTDGVVIEDVQVKNSSGCSRGTTAVALSLDFTAFTVTYSDYLAQAGGGAGKKDGVRQCSLRLKIRAPKNFTYAIGSTDYRGFAHLEPGATATQTAVYSFKGPGQPPTAAHDLAGPYDDYWQTTDPGPSAYEACGKQRHLNIDTTLTVRAGTSDPSVPNIIAMDATDGTVLRSTYRLLWHTC